MIPKILHYVWLGHGEPSDTIKRCRDSWDKNLSDYQIMLWNEETFDIISAPQFVKDAYSAKKWAFASDYIRLWALHEYGGIYLDTDTEVRKPLDIFLNHRLFIGTQVFNIDIDKKNKKTVTNLSMGVIGSEPHHPYIRMCKTLLENTHLLNNDGNINTTVTNYSMSNILQQEYGFEVEDVEQHLQEGIVILPSTVFTDRLSPKESPDCYTYHWGEMSWFQPKPRGVFYKFCWNLNLMRVYRWIEQKRK